MNDDKIIKIKQPTKAKLTKNDVGYWIKHAQTYLDKINNLVTKSGFKPKYTEIVKMLKTTGDDVKDLEKFKHLHVYIEERFQ